MRGDGGGLGVETVVEITEDNIEVNVFGDGVRPEAAAFGLAGGKPASANFLQITLPTGERYLPNSKDLVGPLPKGTIIHQIAGGGGGYGPPEHRSQEQIEYDLQAGFVSEEAAKLLYGYRSPDKKRKEAEHEKYLRF